jgi:hypothetical protein
LPRPIQESAQQRFGHDFSAVRVFDADGPIATADGTAAAFALGNDVVFAPGRYDPDHPRGRHLIEHELAHVAQQRNASAAEGVAAERPFVDEERLASDPLARRPGSVAQQHVAYAPEDESFHFESSTLDRVGNSIFGTTAWPFIKAVFEGFIGGLIKDVKSGRADKAKEHLKDVLYPWNAGKFYGGYLLGLVIGFFSPITDLIKGIIGAVKLAIGAAQWLVKWSPLNVAAHPELQLKVARLLESFTALGGELAKSYEEFKKDPKSLIDKLRQFFDEMMQRALGKAREIGGKAADSIFDLLDLPFFEMGKRIGEVIGALLAQVLLLVFSDAIGNLIAKGAALLGEAAEFVAGKAAKIFEWVKGFATEIAAALRSAAEGALKILRGLAQKAIEAFDSLKAIFVEAEELEPGASAAGDQLATSGTKEMGAAGGRTGTAGKPSKLGTHESQTSTKAGKSGPKKATEPGGKTDPVKTAGESEAPPGSVGAMRRYEYEASPKHGVEVRGTAKGVANPAPRNGQAALDASVQVKPTSPRRVGIDYEADKFVVFDETHPNSGVYHGHVRSWDELHPDMQRALQKAGMANRRGKILTGTE